MGGRWFMWVLALAVICASAYKMWYADDLCDIVVTGNLGAVKAAVGARKLSGRTVDDTPYLRFGLTPLMDASRLGRNEIVMNLINEGADVNIRDGLTDYPPLLWGIKHSHVVRTLIRNGAHVNATAGFGSVSGVLLAAHKGLDDVLEQLVIAKADVTHADTASDTALHKASEGLLSCMGIDPTERRLAYEADPENVPQMEKIEAKPECLRFETCIHWLLKGGAKVSAVNSIGERPYCWTAPCVLDINAQNPMASTLAQQNAQKEKGKDKGKDKFSSWPEP